MAWQDEMIDTLRVLLNDLDATPTYSDDRLQQLLVIAARHVLTELDFPTQYKIDYPNLNILPDPTLTATRNDSFINLVCLKGAAIMERSETRIAANQAIAIRDGSSAIDLRDALKGKLALIEKGWAAVYEDAKLEYKTNMAGVIAGAAVIGPFRYFARGSSDAVFRSQTYVMRDRPIS